MTRHLVTAALGADQAPPPLLVPPPRPDAPGVNPYGVQDVVGTQGSTIQLHPVNNTLPYFRCASGTPDNPGRTTNKRFLGSVYQASYPNSTPGENGIHDHVFEYCTFEGGSANCSFNAGISANKSFYNIRFEHCVFHIGYTGVEPTWTRDADRTVRILTATSSTEGQGYASCIQIKANNQNANPITAARAHHITWSYCDIGVPNPRRLAQGVALGKTGEGEGYTGMGFQAQVEFQNWMDTTEDASPMWDPMKRGDPGVMSNLDFDHCIIRANPAGRIDYAGYYYYQDPSDVPDGYSTISNCYWEGNQIIGRHNYFLTGAYNDAVVIEGGMRNITVQDCYFGPGYMYHTGSTGGSRFGVTYNLGYNKFLRNHWDYRTNPFNIPPRTYGWKTWDPITQTGTMGYDTSPPGIGSPHGLNLSRLHHGYMQYDEVRDNFVYMPHQPVTDPSIWWTASSPATNCMWNTGTGAATSNTTFIRDGEVFLVRALS